MIRNALLLLLLVSSHAREVDNIIDELSSKVRLSLSQLEREHRALQSSGNPATDALCTGLKKQFFDGCECGPDPDSDKFGDLQLNCVNFCTLCLDSVDFCTSLSFAQKFSGFQPTKVRVTQQMTGEDSSKSTVVIEDTLENMATKGCNVFINDQPCRSCLATPSDTCKDGAVIDCTNLPGIPKVVDTCNDAAMMLLPSTDAFFGQGARFSYSACQGSGGKKLTVPTGPLSNPTAPAPTIDTVPQLSQKPVSAPQQQFPPKKIIPDNDDDDKKDSKLFSGGYVRGNLSRRLLKGSS